MHVKLTLKFEPASMGFTTEGIEEFGDLIFGRTIERAEFDVLE